MEGLRNISTHSSIELTWNSAGLNVNYSVTVKNITVASEGPLVAEHHQLRDTHFVFTITDPNPHDVFEFVVTAGVTAGDGPPSFPLTASFGRFYLQTQNHSM